MYGNPYINNYGGNFNPQNTYNRIDEQIAQLQSMKEQIKNSQPTPQNQQPSINQTFQLAPNGNGGIRYVNSIDDVNKETVFMDTPFFSKDLSVMWLKNSTGDIKAYELNEIVQKDEKDLQIEFLIAQQEEKNNRIDLLQAQLDELKGRLDNEQFYSNDDSKQISTNASTINESVGKSIEKSESTSLSRVSTSKKK